MLHDIGFMATLWYNVVVHELLFFKNDEQVMLKWFTVINIRNPGFFFYCTRPCFFFAMLITFKRVYFINCACGY